MNIDRLQIKRAKGDWNDANKLYVPLEGEFVLVKATINSVVQHMLVIGDGRDSLESLITQPDCIIPFSSEVLTRDTVKYSIIPAREPSEVVSTSPSKGINGYGYAYANHNHQLKLSTIKELLEKDEDNAANRNIYSGKGVPSSGLGNVGDIYIRYL
jgi:hypothetical protein